MTDQRDLSITRSPSLSRPSHRRRRSASARWNAPLPVPLGVGDPDVDMAQPAGGSSLPDSGSSTSAFRILRSIGVGVPNPPWRNRASFHALCEASLLTFDLRTAITDMDKHVCVCARDLWRDALVPASSSSPRKAGSRGFECINIRASLKKGIPFAAFPPPDNLV